MARATARAAKAATILRTVEIPEIGAYWDGQGGTFVGIGRRQGEKRDHLVILAKVEKKSGTFEQNLAYAKGLKADGHADFEPAQPEDSALCFANAKHLFERCAYWTGKQSADVERWAWYQSFYDGFQYGLNKSAELRLFAVRRIPI